ncbi:phosphoenolpyruvate-protein phosphotransferase [Aliidongia dinghuensis]|uniref:Phosphoenolpyruvate-protein phosphotransferase n=1 Tax=Aliidongia dinghuensis TaxID=1867774 RepID=A0A8J3E7Q4_9PROT|nr:putative PEP-binding protein [Aliidongia dinghuensis]GGF47493.1 phosphoenolpyruvate-protein phosphotransferase [Aliidongia dinghuensis]
MAERRLHGRSAAPGLAHGMVAVLDPGLAERRPAGEAAEETAALQQAIAAALAELEMQVRRLADDAADMLGFQLAILSDDELARPAWDAIVGGASADVAWCDVMAAEIAHYAAGDEYFAARTADLEDIRDRVLRQLTPGSEAAAIPAGAVVVAADLPLSRFLSIDWLRGGAIVLTDGSPSGHVAMLARARGVPMVTGVGGAPASLAGVEALVDAVSGEVVLDPSDATRADFAAKCRTEAAVSAGRAEYRYRDARTADGARIKMNLNISDIAELDGLDPAICDGIGLVRTELLFRDQAALLDENTQFEAYRRLAVWAEGRPVTIRTLDAGGDKPIPGVTIDGESNPFLGLRGIRLSLRHPDLFRTQLRALARAAVHGNVRIMLPMVTIPAELEAARAMLNEAVDSLAAEGIAARRPALGIMVEVPAAAIAIDEFNAGFFSIGSNDLIQYVTAAGRDIAAVAELANPRNPAVLRLIAAIVRHGAEAGREVSLCGDAGADPALVTTLLRTGLRSLSVAPSALERTKEAVAATDLRLTLP